MKIRTNVKAEGIPTNHNEKLTDDVNAIEQKKTIGKKLYLSKETVRILIDGDLKRIAGGARVSGTPDCSDSCGITINTSCCP